MVDSYPNYKPNNISETVDVWNMMLSDYDYNLVAMALKGYILSDTSGFAPSIGQLVAKIQKITQPQELSEMEAWALVSMAIRNSIYNSAEEFAKLPPLVQKAIGIPEQLRTWAIDENFNEEVASSNFMRCYRNELKRHEEFQRIPEDIRKLIDNASKNSYSAKIEEERQRAIKISTERKENEIKALEKKAEYNQMPDDLIKRWEEFENSKIN